MRRLSPLPEAPPAPVVVPPAPPRLSLLAYGALVLLCVALYLPGFTVLPPFDRDEARFAQASSQMLETRDFVDIRFQDEARYKKPIGIYWLQSASAALVAPLSDKPIWAYRVPSLMGAVLAVLATAWAGTRAFGPAAGAFAAVMLAGSVVLGVEARMAKTDAVLLATVVMAQAALASLYLRRGGEPPGRAPALVFWVAVGVGILVKGPIVLLVSGATVLILMVWDHEAAWLKGLRPLMGLGVVAAIALPWLAAIALQTNGAFFTEAVGHDMLAKVARGQEGKGLPPGYYLLTSLITFAPFAFLALPAVPWAWRHRGLAAVRFCIAWIVPTWLVFEVVPTKLLHYTLPVFPAVAMLTAAAALDHFGRPGTALDGTALDGTGAVTGPAGRTGRVLAVLGQVVALVAFAGLAVAVAVVPWLVERRIDGLAVAAVAPVVGVFLLAQHLARHRQERAAILAALAAAGMLYATTYQAVLPGIDGLWVSRQAARAVAAQRPCPGSVVAAAGYSEPSLVFLLGTATRLGDGARAAAHLDSDRACALALVEANEDAAFRAALGTAGPVAVAHLGGFNYSNGRRVALTLYKAGGG